jgi:dihydropteroate synthase
MELFLSEGKVLRSRHKSLVMGILNATPDSFYEGSRKTDLESGKAAARSMIEAGADILDIGGESTRPGAAYVEAEDEISRVVPLIRGIREFSDIAISIDTRKAATAEAAISAGADIINDVSALKDDPEIGILAADRDMPVILMHMRGTPETMQINPQYTDVVEEIVNELELCISRARSYGINKKRIIIDPGIGFGKRLEDNLLILKHLNRFKAMDFPLLIGLSRKSFLGKITGADVNERLTDSISANMYAVMHGADILRVHDVAETCSMLDIISAIEGVGC